MTKIKPTSSSSRRRPLVSSPLKCIALIVLFIGGPLLVHHRHKITELSIVASKSLRGLSLTTTMNVLNEGSSSCDPNIIYRGPAGLPAIKRRAELGDLMEARGYTDGAEVGVQSGNHAKFILNQWKSCQSFKLVDLWAHQINYKDNANVPDQKQEELFQTTQKNLEPWKAKTEFFRMLSTEAAAQIPDQSLDFVYLDARHDYCGVMEDIVHYYPKLRPGGIMAGHDYLDNAEIQAITPQQDWSLCMNGTVNTRAVKGAVEDFVARNGLVVSVAYKDGETPSWMLQKPTRMECVTGDNKEEMTTPGKFGARIS